MSALAPASITAFANGAVASLREDSRLLGLAVGGSWVHGGLDEHSDLDLVVVARDGDYREVARDRRIVAESRGHLGAAFTGEHVGEPRLLICLYTRPLLHVDLKFVALADFGPGVERPHVLWERVGELSAALEAAEARWPVMPLQWFEDRFWVWVHYATTKLARGELFEVIDMLTFARAQVLGPLIARLEGALPRGVRRLESLAPGRVPALEATLARHDAGACAAALLATVDLYRTLRAEAEASGGEAPARSGAEGPARSGAEGPAEAYLRSTLSALGPPA